MGTATIAAARQVRTEKAACRRAEVLPIIEQLQANGATSLRQIAAALNERGITTAKGGKWSATQVMHVLNAAETVAA
jgi:hypothetical protein